MVLLRFLSTVICAVLIATGAVSGEDVKKAVGDQVSFRPDKFIPPVTSIIWKHINTGNIVVKAIEWDEGETLIPNPRFQNITKVDEKTGQITIINLKVEHSGVYTIDINSKEQQQRFTLTVMEGVPKPEITIEPTENPDVEYLRCEYNEKIIWKNSTGHILPGSPISPKGESITVKKNGDPNNFYTCTLNNTVSEKTSDPVYERDLFKGVSGGGPWWIVFIVIPIAMVASATGLYKFNDKFHKFVDGLRGKESKNHANGPNNTDDSNNPDKLLPSPKQNESPSSDADNNTTPALDSVAVDTEAK
ncbi:uncharacterized protein si:ch211-132g1.3 [Megalobrama amblycephala]|uniref:uncharacterized protein si:ch211-132g1.3 n=1 Tax=Megalobrama amblycephala TaxID=75352 RepID=UPI002013E0CB|nr:uncharacterized protein si:ch211-132g1.3 [Megalobrama amblycephala]